MGADAGNGAGAAPEPASDDAALMALYAKGDGQAFEILYRRHRGPLYRYIARLRARRMPRRFSRMSGWR